MTNITKTEEFPITLTDSAKEFLEEQLQREGLERKTVKFSMVFGKNSQGKGIYKYQVETVHAPDCTLELDNGFTVIVDGNSSLLMKGTIVDVKEGMSESGQPVKGFVFSNPNAKNPVIERGCQGCPSATDKGCGSSKGCSEK